VIDARRPVPAWATALMALAACEAVTLAVWLLSASITIVQWPATGPVRLALLAPAWQLAAWWMAGLAVAVVVWRRRWTRDPPTMPPPSAAATPPPRPPDSHE